MDGSPPLALSTHDLLKTGKGLGVCMVGAGLSYLATVVIPGLDATHYPWLIPVASWLVNLARKWLTDTTSV